MSDRRLFAAAVAAGLAALATGVPQKVGAQPSWLISIVQVPGGAAEVFAGTAAGVAAVIVESRDGRLFVARLQNGAVTLALTADAVRPPAPRRPGMLPDGEVTTGAGLIAEAYLTGPTGRYPHGIIGDAIEASGLRVVTSERVILDATLGPGSVFEDRLARLADIDGDGTDDVIVVHTYLDRGAALSAYTVRDGALVRLAEAPAFGRPSRWLNPIGVADFDGDATPEAAAFITPHIGGILKFYSVRGDLLVEEGSAGGFSNHAIGSRALGLSAVFDANGDGIPDIALPDARRRAIRIMTFAAGAIGELANIALPSRVRTGFVRLPGPDLVFVFGLENGSLAVLSQR